MFDLKLAIPDVILITPVRFEDNRGFFTEIWNKEKYKKIGIDQEFLQDNQSLSLKKGTVRGLHLQIAPNPQGKLVSCSQGSIWDVAVDVRKNSLTFGQHVAALLSEKNNHQLWIPPGFAHGFSTLEDNTKVSYKVTGNYDKNAERGILWNDRDLNIHWHINPAQAILSAKDQQLPQFKNCEQWDF